MKTRRGAEICILRFVILAIAIFQAGHEAVHACQEVTVYATIASGGSGSENVSPKQIAVTISPSSSQYITVPFSVDAVSTANGTDFSIASYSLTFAPGETTKYINITIYDDTLDENDETIKINLNQPTNAVLGWPSTSTYTILDNDPLPTITIESSGYGNESVTSKTLMVSLSPVSGRAVTVPYTVGGTATGNGADYSINSNTLSPLTIPAGKAGQGIVLSINNDSLDEANETVAVSLSTPTNGSLGSSSSSTYTIQDNDVSAPTGFSAMRNVNDPTHGIILAWTDNSANETGYQIERSTDNVNWSPYSLSANVTSCQQSGLAPNTHYYYRLKALKGSASSSYATADAWTATPPHLDAPSSNQYTVNLSWSAYDTHAASDLIRYDVYCGETTPTQCIGNTIHTSYAHQVNIGSKFNYYKVVAVTGSASVPSDNIIDKTTAPSSLSINSIADQSESAADSTVTVMLSPQSAVPVTAHLIFETTGSMAELGTNRDLTTKTATLLTFTPGQITKSIGIHIVNDDISEPSESVILDILPINGASCGEGYTRTFFINDDDYAPIINSFTSSENVFKPKLDYVITSPTDPQRRIRIYKTDPKDPISLMQIQNIYDNATTYTTGSIVDSSYPEFGLLAAPGNLFSPQVLNSTTNIPTLTLSWTKNDDQVTSHLYAIESIQMLTGSNADGLMNDCLSRARTFETMRLQNGVAAPLSLLNGSLAGVSVAADCNVTTAPGYKALKVVIAHGSSASIAYTLGYDEHTTVQQHQDFMVSAWHRNNGSGGRLSLQYQTGSDWTTAGLATASSGGDQWEKLEFYARVPNNTYTGLRLIMQSGAGTSYWDELSLKKMIQGNHARAITAYEVVLTTDSANSPTSTTLPIAGYTCQATTATTQTHTFTNLKDGKYYAHVRAVDVFGNRSGWTNLGYWEIDQMQPIEPVLSDVKSVPVANPSYIRAPFMVSGSYNGPFDSTGQLKIRITAENALTNAVCAETTLTVTSAGRDFSCSNMSLPGDGRYRFHAIAVRTIGGRSNCSGKSNQIYRTRDTAAPVFEGLVRARPVFKENNVNQVNAELAWRSANDSGPGASGVDHYDLFTTTGTTLPLVAFATVSHDNSTTITYTYSNLDRDTSQTLFAVKAIDIAGNMSSTSGLRFIYGTPLFSGKWHVNDNQWATSLTLTFNCQNQTGRRMYIWGSDFHPVANLTHEWADFQEQISPIYLLSTQNTSKWLYAQGMDGSGNYSVPVACNEYFQEPRVLKSIDLVRVDSATSVSVASSATYRSGAQIHAYLVGYDQYGHWYPLDEILDQFEYNVQNPSTIAVTRAGTLFTINCGLIGGATLVVTNTNDASIKTTKSFVVEKAGALSRIEVSGPPLLKSGMVVSYSATGYDDAGNPLGVSPEWKSDLIGHIAADSGMLTACMTDSVVTGTVQAHYLGVTGSREVMVDGKAPVVCGISLNPGPNGDSDISTQTQQISIGTNDEEHALPAFFSVYIDDRFIGSITQVDNSQTTYTSVELQFNPANMRMGLHKVVVVSQDSLANSNEPVPFVKYIRTPAGNPPSSAIDWLLVYQTLEQGPEQGTWILNGHDYSYHLAGNLDQPTDTIAATVQEVAEALLTLKDYDPEYVASQNNVSIKQQISVKQSIDAGLAYLAGKLLDKTVQDPTTRMYAAETVLLLRDRGSDIVLPDSMTSQSVKIAWSDIVDSAMAVVRENLARGADGGIGVLGLQGSSHLATMRAIRLAMATTGTLTSEQVNSQIDDWKRYLAYNFEILQSGETVPREDGGWALNQRDWWNQSRICCTTAEILHTVGMIAKRYGRDADTDRLMSQARAFLESRTVVPGSASSGYGDPRAQDSNEITTSSVISTASTLWALKQAGLIEPQTLLDGVGFLDAAMRNDHSWNERAMDTALALRLMKPDMTISAIGSPTLNRTTGRIEYPVCVRNIGVRSAYSFDVTAHSVDPNRVQTALRANSEIGHSTKAIGILEPNESTTVTVSTEDTAEVIHFMVDSGDRVQELDEDNNTKSLKPDPRPDLMVVASSIKFGKLNGTVFTEDSLLFADKPWAVQVTVKNIGLGTVHASDSANVSIYFGNYPDPTAKLITTGPIKELTVSSTDTFNIPMSDILGVSLEDGDYPVSVQINPGSAREVSSNNNSAVRIVHLYPPIITKIPDLEVSPLTLSVEKVKAGVPFKVLGSVTNLGKGIAHNPDLEMTIDGLTPTSPEQPLGDLQPGEVAPFEFWAMLSIPGGMIEVRADPYSRLKEVRKDNNATSASVVISKGVDLAVAPRNTDVQIRKNDGLWELTVIVRNFGDAQFIPGPNPPMVAVSKWQDGVWATMNKVCPAQVNKVMGVDEYQKFTWSDCPFETGENRIHIELVGNDDDFPGNDSRDVNFKIEPVNYSVGYFWAEPACQTLDPAKATAPFRFHYEIRNPSNIAQNNIRVELRNGDNVLWGRNITRMDAHSTTSGLTREIGIYPPSAMLTLVVDPFNEMIETDETDNTTNTTVAVISKGIDPDLAFAGETFDVKTGDDSGDPQYMVSLKVVNLPGPDGFTPDPSGRFRVAVYRTDDNTTIAETVADSIPGRMQVVVPVVIKDADLFSSMRIKLDAVNEVKERDEGNNEMTLALSRVPVPANVTARSILQDGRITWSDSPNIGTDGYIDASELSGYRISRSPAWKNGPSTFVSKTAAKNGAYVFYDSQLDAATSYTYRIATMANNGMESMPVAKSLKTSSVPVIEGYYHGEILANDSIIQAQLSSDRKLYLNITAPQADKVTLYRDSALTGTVLVDSDHDGVFGTTETLHIGRQTFIAQPMAEYNDGNGTTVALGMDSPAYAVTYQTGIDLAISPYELKIQNWDGSSWKNVTPKEINDLKGEQKFRVKAVVHNTETVDAPGFKVNFSWTTNLRSLSNATKITSTSLVQLDGLPAGQQEEVYSCNLATESAVFVKPADRMVQEIAVLADSDYEIVETFEYNNHAQVTGAEYACDNQYDFVFLLDRSAENNLNDYNNGIAEIKRWIGDLNDTYHRVALVTFDSDGATTITSLQTPSQVLLDDYLNSTTLLKSGAGSGRKLATAIQYAGNLFRKMEDANRKDNSVPVIVLVDGGDGANYERTNIGIEPGSETTDLLAAIGESSRLKRDINNPNTIGYTKGLKIYQLHFTQTSNDQWPYQEEAMFMRHLNSELDANLQDLMGSSYVSIVQNGASDDEPIAFGDEVYQMHSSNSLLDGWGEPATQYDRYWLEGFTQVRLNSNIHHVSSNTVVAELKGAGICRGILLWPKYVPIPSSIASQGCSLWPTEGRYGYRRWMLNYGIRKGSNGPWEDYDQYIMDFYSWKTIKLYGGYINDPQYGTHNVQYAFFAHGDDQIMTMYQIPQDEWVFGRNVRGEKLIDKYMKLAGPGFNHDLNGFNFYYPGLCPDTPATDLSVAFYDPAKEPGATGNIGFPGGVPLPQQSGELVANVKNTGTVLIENKEIRILENDVVTTWTTVTLGPGMTTSIKYDWVNSGADTIILKVETYNFSDSNSNNNSDTFTIHNDACKPNFKWNALWVNGHTADINGSTHTLPVRWQVDQVATITAEYDCEKYLVTHVSITDGVKTTTETVSVGGTKFQCKQLIPIDEPTQPELRMLVLDPDNKIIESNEVDNGLPVRLKFLYLYQDAEIADLACVDRDASGTLHVRATVKRNCPAGQSYPFEKVGVYLFNGVWIQDSETNAMMADQTVHFDGLSSDSTQTIDFWIQSDPATTTTLSVVADPFISELHENPSGGRDNNSQTLVIPPSYINLSPKTFVMQVNEVSTDTVKQGVNGVLKLVSHYGFGDDIPTSVTYKVRFWKHYPDRLHGELIGDQIVSSHLRSVPDRLIEEALNTLYLEGPTAIYAEIDPRDHLAAAAGDRPSTVSLNQSRPWAVCPITPKLRSNSASGAWYIDLAFANGNDSTSYCTVAQWRSDRPGQAVVSPVISSGPVLLRLRSDRGLPTFSAGDHIRLNFGQLNTSSLFRANDEASATASQNGWCWKGSAITHRMDYFTTDPTHEKILFLSTETTGPIVGSFMLGDDDADSNPYDVPFNKALPCVSMGYNNLHTSETLTIEFLVNTTSGPLTMSFATVDSAVTTTSTHLNFALGSGYRVSGWKNLFLDLNSSLQAEIPGARIVSFNGLCIKSNGVLIDEILLGGKSIDFYNASSNTNYVDVELPELSGDWISMALWVAADGSTYYANSMHMMSDPNAGTTAQAHVDLNSQKAMHDVQGMVGEIDETDNMAQLVVNVTPTDCIDMAVDGISAGKIEFSPGEGVPVTIALHNLLAAHSNRGILRIYADNDIVTTQPVNTDGMWVKNEARCELTTVSTSTMTGSVVVLRAVLDVDGDTNPDNDSAETSITLTNVVSLAITNPMPSEAAPGEEIWFSVEPRSTPPMSGDVLLWIVPANGKGEASAVARLTTLADCFMTTTSSYECAWPGDVGIPNGRYRIYGQLRINGNIAREAVSSPFTITSAPVLSVSIATDRLEYEEEKPVQIDYSIMNRSPHASIDHVTTVTVNVRSRDYCTSFTTTIDRLEINQTLNFRKTINALPSAEYDAIAAAVCVADGLSASAGTSFNVGSVGELPLERLMITNAESANPLYLNSVETTLTLDSVGAHEMDSGDFMWIDVDQPLAVANRIDNGDMSVPSGSGAMAWSGGTRVSAGPGKWALRIVQGTSATTSQTISGILPRQNYCLSFVADRLTSDITVTIGQFSHGGVKSGEPIVINTAGTAAWDGTHHRYEIPFRTSGGTHVLDLKFEWAGAGSLDLSSIQLTPGSVGMPYRGRVVGLRANLIENQALAVDSGVAFERIQPGLSKSLDAHGGNGIPDGWRLDGVGTVTLSTDPTLPNWLKELGIQSTAVIAADSGNTTTLVQWMIPVQPNDTVSFSAEVLGSGRVSMIGHGVDAESQACLGSLALNSTEWTSATQAIEIPVGVYNLGIEFTTSNTLSITAVSMVDSQRSSGDWSGWIPYAPRMRRTLADGPDGARPLFSRYLSDTGNPSLHNAVALTRDSDCNGYPDAVSGSNVVGAIHCEGTTSTALSITAAIDGRPETSVPVDSATSVGMTVSMPNVHYIECLRLAASFQTTATLKVEGSLDGHIWLPVGENTSITAGQRDVLISIRSAFSHWRMTLVPAEEDTLEGVISEAELRGLASEDADTVILDRVSPVTHLRLVSPARTNSMTADFAGDAEDAMSGVGRIEYRMVSPVAETTGTIAAPGIPSRRVDYTLSRPVASEGLHQLFVRSFDQAGNVSEYTSTSLTVDRTGPVIWIDQPTSGTWFNRPAIASWSSSETLAASFGIDVLRPFNSDDVTTSTFENNQQATLQGRHTIVAWGADDLGNAGPCAATAFGIDLTSPTITLVPTVPSVTNQTSVTLEGIAADGIEQSGLASVQLSIDALGQWASIDFNAGTGAYAVAIPLGAGEHLIMARSVDRAGNVSAVETRNIVVDLSPPIMCIDSPSSGTWTNTAQTMHWNTLASDLACSHGLLAWHSLDGTSTATLNAVCGDEITSEGSFLLTVHGTDWAGNDGPTTATAFGIDKTAPIMQIIAPSNDTWTSQPVILLWTTLANDLASSEGLLTWHPLDGSSTTTLAVARGELAILEGRYGLAVHGTDRVGNLGPEALTFFGIDETCPIITLNALNDTSNSVVSCSGTADDGHGSGIRKIYYRVDGGGWHEVTSVSAQPTPGIPTHTVYEFSVTFIVSGWHEIETRAIDQAGNTSLLALRSVLVDLDAPAISITHPVQNDTLFNTFQIDGRVSDTLSGVRAVQYRFDQQDETWQDATVTSDTFSAIVNSWGLAEGQTSLTLRAVDTLGNDWDRSSEDANPVYRTIMINNNYPPQAPTGLHASYSSYTVLELTWNKNTEADFSHYRIYRRQNDTSAFSEADLRAGNVTDTSGTTLNVFTDQVTTETATPNYWKLAMHAVDKAGNVSLISDTISVPPPGTPLLHDAKGGDRFVKLRWDPVGEGFVKGYYVYRCQSEDPTSFTLYRTIEGKTNSEMTDTSVTYNLPYWYYVKAFDGAKNVSQPSIQVKGVPNFVPNVEKTVIVAFEDAANNNNIEWDFDDVLVRMHGRLFLDQNDCVTSVSLDATLSIHDANTKYNVYTGFLNFVGTGTYSGTVWKDETKQDKDEDIDPHVYQPNSTDLLTANIPLFKDVNNQGDRDGYFTELTLVLDNPSSNPLARFDKVPFDTWITVKRSNNPRIYSYHIYDPTDPGCPYFNNAVLVTNDGDPLQGVYLNTALVIPLLNWDTAFNSTLWTVYPDFIGYANTYRTGTTIENTTWYLNKAN